MLDIQGIGYSEKGPNPLVQNTASPIFVAILLFFLVLIWLLCVSGSEEQLSPAHDILFWDQIIQTDHSHFFVLRRIFFGFFVISIHAKSCDSDLFGDAKFENPRQFVNDIFARSLELQRCSSCGRRLVPLVAFVLCQSHL